MRKRRRKKKYELNALDRFVIKAREQGLTYAQAQVKETCELMRRQEIRNRLLEKHKRG